MVGVDDGVAGVDVLLAGAEEAGEPAAGVRAGDPLAGRAELELCSLGLLADGVDGGEQGRGVDTVEVLGCDGHDSAFRDGLGVMRGNVSGSRTEVSRRKRPAGWPGGQLSGFDVERPAQVALQLREPPGVGELGQLTGDPEGVADRVVSLLPVRRHRDRLVGRVTQHPASRLGEQLGVPERVREAVSGDGVAVVAGVAHQRPARPGGLSHVVGQGDRSSHRCGDLAGAHPLAQVGRAILQGGQQCLGPVGTGGQHRRQLAGRADQPDGGLAMVGREHAGEGLVAEVELEAVPRHPADVRVEAGAARCVRLQDARPDQVRRAGADAVGADHEPGGQLEAARGARLVGEDSGHPAVRAPDDVGHGRPGHQRGTRADRSVGEDRVQDVAAGREHHVDACLVLDRQPERSVGPLAVLLEQDGAHRGRAAVEHVTQQPPPRQLDDAAADQRVGRGGVAGQLGPVQQQDVVAGPSQQHRGGCSGGPGPDDDDVVVAPDNCRSGGRAQHRRSFGSVVKRLT